MGFTVLLYFHVHNFSNIKYILTVGQCSTPSIFKLSFSQRVLAATHFVNSPPHHTLLLVTTIHLLSLPVVVTPQLPQEEDWCRVWPSVTGFHKHRVF